MNTGILSCSCKSKILCILKLQFINKRNVCTVKIKRGWKEQNINVNKVLSLGGGTMSDFAFLYLSLKLFFKAL